jgi:DNA-binding NtrC family response regulator
MQNLHLLTRAVQARDQRQQRLTKISHTELMLHTVVPISQKTKPPSAFILLLIAGSRLYFLKRQQQIHRHTLIHLPDMKTPQSKSLNIAVTEDENTTAELISRQIEYQGHHATICNSVSSTKELNLANFDALLLDLGLPDGDGLDLLCWAQKTRPSLPCYVVTATDQAATAVAALKAGARDYFTKPLNFKEIFKALRIDLQHQPTSNDEACFPTLEKWKSDAMACAMNEAIKASGTDNNVLIIGEEGTGKSAIGRFIHHNSQQKGNGMVTVDGSRKDFQTLERELFGEERPSQMKGSIRHGGKINTLESGSLFITNVDQLSEKLQYLLYQALEENRHRRFRLITSASLLLPTNLGDKNFLKPLYYLISTEAIRAPSLREATQDIPLWTNHLLTEICITLQLPRPMITSGAMEALLDNPWPGNLHQLRQVLTYAVTHSKGGLLGLDHLPAQLLTAEAQSMDKSQIGLIRKSDFERESLIAALKACDNNRRRAAKRLGVSLRTIYNLIQRYGLNSQRKNHQKPNP